MVEYEIHELATIFPSMTGEEFEAFKLDIKQNGLRVPIKTYKGAILDGRHRYQACQELGIEAEFEALPDDTDLVAYVRSANIKTRHLNQSQVAAVSMELDALAHKFIPQHRTQESKPNRINAVDIDKQYCKYCYKDVEVELGDGVIECEECGHGLALMHELEPIKQLAKQAGVSARTYTQAKKAYDYKEDPNLFKQIKQGKKSAVETERIIKREERLKSIAENKTKPPDGVYSVILADPPWQYNRGTLNASSSAEHHYPTMELDDICSFLINQQIQIADEAVLYLWATPPCLSEALQVMEVWGFEYKTHIVWDKTTRGMGYMGFWTKARHELLLIGAKPETGAPDKDTRPWSVIEIPKTKKHSEKPQQFHEVIENCWPNTSKLELFGRAKRGGWTVYGNEV